MSPYQPAIVGPVPSHARILSFGLAPGADRAAALGRVREVPIDRAAVVGVGAPLLARGVAGLRAFPAVAGPGVSFPSTQHAVWAFLQGDDPGELLHRARKLAGALGEAFTVEEDVATFKFAEGRDLTGYEDGTENPTGERALETALVAGRGPGWDGASFVSAQRWVHDLPRFERMSPVEQDHTIGRARETNEELADAPASAHVKRTAQESFDPPAFMLRRSMPFSTASEHGLYFVAFGASLDPFERVLRRMAGLEDGTPDALLRFSRAVTGAHYFCPAVREGCLDLRALEG